MSPARRIVLATLVMGAAIMALMALLPARAAADACCDADGTCTDETAASCTAARATPQGPGTTCATSTCSVTTTQACCLPAGCRSLTPAQCVGRGGVPMGAGTTCSATTCAAEACCL